MSRSDVEHRYEASIDRERAYKALEALKMGARLTHADLEFLVGWVGEQFTHKHYRHVKSDSIYKVVGFAVRVGDDDMATVVVGYHQVEPLSAPKVIFTRPWGEFLARFQGVSKVERWES